LEALSVFKEYYGTNCQDKTRPYDGIPEVLAQLAQKYPMAVVSNKPDPATKDLCAHYFPTLYAQGQTPDCPRKPAPDMVHKTMAVLGIDHCIYIGDSEVDILTAQNAKVRCLSVCWGFRDEDQLVAAGGTDFCNDTAKILEKIEEMTHGK
jgi:phosphoglycolate phosphatase